MNLQQKIAELITKHNAIVDWGGDEDASKIAYEIIRLFINEVDKEFIGEELLYKEWLMLKESFFEDYE